MPVQRIVSHEAIEENQGRIALQYGPLVYCLEAVDNSGEVFNQRIPDSMRFEVEFLPEVLGGINILWGIDDKDQRILTAIPYYAWSHRGIGEMTVWILRAPE